MGYERNSRGNDPFRDDDGRRDSQDEDRLYGGARSYGQSYGSDQDRDRWGGGDPARRGGGYGRGDDDRGYGRSSYGRSDEGQGGYGGSGYGRGGYGQGGGGSGGYERGGEGRGGYGRSEYGNAGYAQGGGYGQSSGRSGGRDEGRYRSGGYGGQYGAGRSGGGQDRGQSRYARGDEYHGSYASDGHRWEDVGSRRHQDDDDRRPRGGGDYGRQPQGYDYDDRGFLARAGDEVRSWFGDEEAERRREADSRYDERYYDQRDRHERDGDYHQWRSGQIAALDRDYDEYRRENRSKFDNEFGSWRTTRQTQRQSLEQVKEHAEVVGSDGSHVGTVDKVRGDRILLTKNDKDAGGQHHSIPSSWIQSVDEKKVTLSKTADEAKRQWRDEEQKQALFGYGDNNADRGRGAGGWQGNQSATGGQSGQGAAAGQAGAASQGGTGTDLNRSFSGTYDNKS